MGIKRRFAFVMGGLLLASCAKQDSNPVVNPMIQSPLRIQSIEAYGDSLTSGFLADTQLTPKRPFYEMGQLMFQLGLTLGKEEKLQTFSRFELAWPKKLSEIAGSNPKLSNWAVPNVGVDALVNQADQMPETQGASAFVFIGHNDLCRTVGWTDGQVADYFKVHIENGVKKWEEKHQNSTLYFLPVGRMDKVYQKLWDFKWNETDRTTNRCRDIYLKYIPMCLPIAELALKGKVESVIGERAKKMNRVLEDVAQKNNGGNKNRYQYLSSMEKVEFKEDLFAMDCFHLSAEGQKQLAETVWKAIQ